MERCYVYNIPPGLKERWQPIINHIIYDKHGKENYDVAWPLGFLTDRILTLVRIKVQKLVHKNYFKGTRDLLKHIINALWPAS